VTKRLIERLPAALVFMASAAVVGILGLIVIDVTIRSFGGRPPAYTIGLVEYLSLYFTMFAAPYLVREKGHVYIQTLVSHLKGSARSFVRRCIYLVSLASSGLFAAIAVLVLLEKLASGDIDMRGIDLPGWLVIAPLVLGYGLVAVEFLRALILDEDLGDGGEAL